MIIAVVVHMFRVFLTGSTSARADSTGAIGVLLMVFALLLSFTGYLLPAAHWIWAVTVAELVDSHAVC